MADISASDSSPHIGTGGGWWVVCLCAAWCNTCTDYRATFEAAAQQWPQMRFEWLDIEDESDIAGDLDVETFPTVLVSDGMHVRFVGPLLPQVAVLTRLIGSLHSMDIKGERQRAGTADAAQALFDNLRKARG